MPAKSKAQQRFMGMVNAVKKGEMKAPSKEVAKTAKGMTKKAAHDFAATKHKGLPEKVKEARKDQDGDGKHDFDDVQIARYKAGGMPPKKAIAKAKSDNLKESKCNCTDEGIHCPEHGLKECPGYMEEAANRRQQAAIAIDMQKHGKKPKKTDESVKEEKWIKVHKSREGMFKGKGEAELQSMKASLKKRNAAKKDKGEAVPEKDKTKMAQLNFALRAKKGHGIHESQADIRDMINDYISLSSIKRLDEEDIRMLNLISEEIAYTLENNMLVKPKTLNESWTHDSLSRHLFETDYNDESESESNGGMAKRQLFTLAQRAIALFKMLEDDDQLEPWVAYKISLATDYIDTVEEYMEYQAAEKHNTPSEEEIPDNDQYMEGLTNQLYNRLRNI
jgi:Protein of unknwon function (DUF3008)